MDIIQTDILMGVRVQIVVGFEQHIKLYTVAKEDLQLKALLLYQYPQSLIFKCRKKLAFQVPTINVLWMG